MIPVFVADRPASLRILSLLDPKNNEYGILSHPYTTERFKADFRNHCCGIKIGDSGIYQGDKLPYEELFSEYVKMGVTHGIIKDYYRDRGRTLKSAILAKREFEKGNFNSKFKLIGVAQGKSLAEYLQSYKEQREDLRFPIVAIGGLLDRTQNDICPVRVTHNTLLKNVLLALRNEYPNDKLFPLGVFNSRRLPFFQEINVWASDYKGWIFRYDIERSHHNGDRYQQIVEYIENVVFPQLKRNPSSNSGKTKKKTAKKRLLIMSCGKAKSEKPGKAIDVYTGPNFQMVKKYLKTNNGLDVKIISAKYGIIDYKDRIFPYELKMSEKSATIYRQIGKQFSHDGFGSYRDIFIVGGEIYQSVFPEIPIEQRAKGTNGKQLQQLKQWLFREC